MRLLVGILCVAALSACDRRVEPYVPGEEPSTPDLSRIFPPESPESPDAGVAAAPAMPPPPPRGAATGPAIRGSIQVAPDLADRVPAGATLFVFARAGAGGPPIAARRIDGPRLPQAFELGPGDRMGPPRPFEGPLRVSARLDADGSATTRSPGDLQGSAREPARPGDRGVVIVLDELL